MTNVCFSGGALGSDLAWGDEAAAAGHQVVHYSFVGHATPASLSQLHRLSIDQLEEGIGPLLKAREKMNHRSVPNRGINKRLDYIRNLLLRNWWQTKDAQTVYAVAEVLYSGEVEGGTAWAIRMFMDRFEEAGPIPVFVWVPSAKRWITWNTYWGTCPPPPRPEGKWAGIGTRKLTAIDRDAIRYCFR